MLMSSPDDSALDSLEASISNCQTPGPARVLYHQSHDVMQGRNHTVLRRLRHFPDAKRVFERKYITVDPVENMLPNYTVRVAAMAMTTAQQVQPD